MAGAKLQIKNRAILQVNLHIAHFLSLLDYTRDKYSPVLVSILITFPISTNNGTITFAPVSTIAGFVAPVAVSPLKPGSVSVISNSTNNGGSTAKTKCVKYVHTMVTFSQ